MTTAWMPMAYPPNDDLFNTSDCRRRGEGKEGGRRKEEGGREWDDAQSDRLFFMLVNRNKKKRGGKRGTLKGGTHDNGEEGKGVCGCQRHIPPTTTYSTRRIIIIVERVRSEEGEGTTRSPTDFFFMLVNPN